MSVRIFQQSIVAVFFLAFFAVSGANGLCGVFSITGLSHHHHGEASHDVKVCFAEEKHCDESPVPCHEAEGDFPDFQFTTPSDSTFFVSSPVLGIVEIPVAVFGELPGISAGEFVSRCESIRGSPVNRHLVLCRFLV